MSNLLRNLFLDLRKWYSFVVLSLVPSCAARCAWHVGVVEVARFLDVRYDDPDLTQMLNVYVRGSLII